jgi:hypothetical protein
VSEDSVTGTLDLLKEILYKIKRMYTPEEYRTLFEQSRRKGKFSVATCNDNFRTEYKQWWPKLYKKHHVSTVLRYSCSQGPQSYFFHFTVLHAWIQFSKTRRGHRHRFNWRLHQKSRDFFLSQRKHSTYRMKRPSLMAWQDWHQTGHEVYWSRWLRFFDFYSSIGDNQQRGPGRIKYLAKN